MIKKSKKKEIEVKKVIPKIKQQRLIRIGKVELKKLEGWKVIESEKNKYPDLVLMEREV